MDSSGGQCSHPICTGAPSLICARAPAPHLCRCFQLLNCEMVLPALQLVDNGGVPIGSWQACPKGPQRAGPLLGT